MQRACSCTFSAVRVMPVHVPCRVKLAAAAATLRSERSAGHGAVRAVLADRPFIVYVNKGKNAPRASCLRVAGNRS